MKARRGSSTLVIPSEGAPRCSCGALKVSVYRDGIEPLIDNMGCELSLERLAGPLCPRCEAAALAEAREGRGNGPDSTPDSPRP